MCADRPVLDIKLNPEMFVVSPNNSFAHATALAMAQALAKAYNPFFTHGGTGRKASHSPVKLSCA